MLCRNCNKETYANSNFCRHCGAEIRSVNNSDRTDFSSSVCPNCGKIIVGVKTFCGGCGTRLTPDAPKTVNPTEHRRSVISARKRNLPTAIFLMLLIIVLVTVIAVVGHKVYEYIEENQHNNGTDSVVDSGVDNRLNNEESDTSESGDNAQKKIQNTKDKLITAQGDYLFPSDSDYITTDDLSGKTKDEVALIRNEIFARHGYIFKTEKYRDYFSAKPWYSPNPNFNESVFNAVESANKEFLVSYEESRGWR